MHKISEEFKFGQVMTIPFRVTSPWMPKLMLFDLKLIFYQTFIKLAGERSLPFWATCSFFFMSNGWHFKQESHPILGILVSGYSIPKTSGVISLNFMHGIVRFWLWKYMICFVAIPRWILNIIQGWSYYSVLVLPWLLEESWPLWKTIR